MSGGKIGEILRNHVKDKLARGEVVASMTVRLVRGIEIARIAKTAGFDSLYVDMEHSSFSLDTTGRICIAALEAGITPFVRVPGVNEVPRVLDAGALGIIAPHVRSADEARAYVSAAKYPPLGDRSAAGPLPHLHYRSFPAAEADAALNAATTLMVQFESDEALANADAIAAVDRRRYGDDRFERPARRLGLARPIRTSAPARGLCQNHRRMPQAWQACRRRRACRAVRSSRRNSCAWARAMSRPAPISAFCSRPPPPKRRRCGTSVSNDAQESLMNPFTYHSDPVRIVFGARAIGALAAEAEFHKMSRLLVLCSKTRADLPAA